MTYQTLTESQDHPEVPINENMEALGQAFTFSKKAPTTTGLTLGYNGGPYDGADIADGTLTLTGSATNYIVVERATGAVTAATSTTNWDDTEDYGRMGIAVCSGSAITSYADQRWSPGGIFAGGAASSGGGGSGTAGKHSIYIPAAAMRPSATGGCAALAAIASASNQPDIVTLDFDTSTEEYAQFSIVMPKSWNEGTITFKAHWSHAATTTNFGVAWKLQAVAVGDDDAIATSFGTAVAVTDTGGTTNDLYATAESSAVTVGGSPGAQEMVFFRVFREPSNGSDNMAIDARLHGITLFFTTDAETEA